jgi:restriction system protein
MVADAEPYPHPTLRRAVVGVLRAQLRVRLMRRGLRQLSGWSVASVLVVVLLITERSWIAGGAVALVLCLATAQWWVGERTLEVSDVAETDSFSGREFERWLGEFFETMGFNVERTPYSGDFGADLIADWNGFRTAVQAKSGHFNAGVRAVQEAATAKTYYGCERAMVVTNQYFTSAAIVLADRVGVVLRTRDDLARKLAELRVG